MAGRSIKCPACEATFTPGKPAPKPTSPVTRRDDLDRQETPRRRPRDEEEEDDRPSRRRSRDDDDDFPRRRNLTPHRGVIILVLGIVALLGALVFAPLLIVGPIAWFMGNADLREIRAGRMDPEGESMTQTGRIMGIVATVLLILGLLATCLFITFFVILAGAASQTG
jgi:hypothetical protein